MSCNNCDSGMGAGWTFLATCFGMIVMGIAFLGSCAIVMGHLSENREVRQVQQQEKVEVY